MHLQLLIGSFLQHAEKPLWHKQKKTFEIKTKLPLRRVRVRLTKQVTNSGKLDNLTDLNRGTIVEFCDLVGSVSGMSCAVLASDAPESIAVVDHHSISVTLKVGCLIKCMIYKTDKS